jgi:hypothetical protein
MSRRGISVGAGLPGFVGAGSPALGSGESSAGKPAPTGPVPTRPSLWANPAPTKPGGAR